ncbi:MAG: hypothetical protein M3552_02255, partial [Planctomycetota bacterium]|nr:hypothetical protein [Planctomycetota bacterium]
MKRLPVWSAASTLMFLSSGCEQATGPVSSPASQPSHLKPANNSEGATMGTVSVRYIVDDVEAA